MKTNRSTKLKALITALAFSGALVLAEAKSAYANPGAGEAGVVLLVVAAVATYATVVTTICTPVAAFKGRDHASGFGGAFKDCWYWYRSSEEAASAAGGETENAVAQAATEDSDRQE